MASNPFEDFRTDTLILGMRQNTMLVAALITAGVAFVVNSFVGGLGMIIIAGLFFKYVGTPAAEWLMDKIPHKYLVHYFDWVTAMNGLHVTNDSSPIPLEIPAATVRSANKPKRHVAADPNAF